MPTGHQTYHAHRRRRTVQKAEDDEDRPSTARRPQTAVSARMKFQDLTKRFGYTYNEIFNIIGSKKQVNQGKPFGPMSLNKKEFFGGMRLFLGPETAEDDLYDFWRQMNKNNMPTLEYRDFASFLNKYGEKGRMPKRRKSLSAGNSPRHLIQEKPDAERAQTEPMSPMSVTSAGDDVQFTDSDKDFKVPPMLDTSFIRATEKYNIIILGLRTRFDDFPRFKGPHRIDQLHLPAWSRLARQIWEEELYAAGQENRAVAAWTQHVGVLGFSKKQNAEIFKIVCSPNESTIRNWTMLDDDPAEAGYVRGIVEYRKCRQLRNLRIKNNEDMYKNPQPNWSNMFEKKKG